MLQQNQIILAVLGVLAWSGFHLGRSSYSDGARPRSHQLRRDASSQLPISRSLSLIDPKTVISRETQDGGLSLPPIVPNSHPTFESLLHQYVLDAERSNYVINIGAKDGKAHDPTYPLLYSGYDGILFEGDEDEKEALYSNVGSLPHSSPFISWGFLTPETVVPRLAEGGARKDADALKVDIDSFDAQLLEAIVEDGYRPKVIMVEFNPDIPPPLSWHQLYSAHPFNFNKVMLGNYGASASAWHEILTEKFGYGLVGMEVVDPSNECARCEHNMWFVSGEILRRRGYRASTHDEMTQIFWETHHALQGGKRRQCLHAKSPCSLIWPEELKGAIPAPGPDDARNDLQVSLMMADPSISCELRSLFDEKVVKPLLNQLHDACNCRGCAAGDPCLEAVGISGAAAGSRTICES